MPVDWQGRSTMFFNSAWNDSYDSGHGDVFSGLIDGMALSQTNLCTRTEE